jgi:Domain of unknown function (DUF4331)
MTAMTTETRKTGIDVVGDIPWGTPGEADKSILIMNVHPSAVVNPPGPTTAEPFAPEALYELKIDTDGDAVADIAYRYASCRPRAGRRPRRCAALWARMPRS